jgi:hypothetical protein
MYCHTDIHYVTLSLYNVCRTFINHVSNVHICNLHATKHMRDGEGENILAITILHNSISNIYFFYHL